MDGARLCTDASRANASKVKTEEKGESRSVYVYVYSSKGRHIKRSRPEGEHASRKAFLSRFLFRLFPPKRAYMFDSQGLSAVMAISCVPVQLEHGGTTTFFSIFPCSTHTKCL